VSHRTLAGLLDEVAARGDAPTVIAHRPGEPETWSGSEVALPARRLARGLAARGAAGTPVLLLGPNAPLWIAAFLGILRAGAMAMPVSEQAEDDELERVLAHSGCRLALVDPGHAGRVAALEHAPEIVVLAPPGEPPPEAGGGATPLEALLADEGALPELAPEQIAALLYTSGTTGTPKGVPLSHCNLVSNVEALRAARLAGAEDRVLLPLPLHHTYPLTVGVLGPLAAGATIVLPSAITGGAVTSALAECRCTIMIAVPRLYEAMLAGIEGRVRARGRLAARLYRGLVGVAVRIRRRTGRRFAAPLFAPLRRAIGPDLRLLASGGARLDPEVAWRLEALGFEVLTGYGLTETAPILTFNPTGRARIESAGRAVEGVELRIAPVEDAPPGQGEIQARGPNVFRGYFANDEATAAAFTEDGFFRTGDLGYIDDDGYLYVVGRHKELIVLAGGKNIFPDEVEAVLGESELVREIAVLEHEGRLVALVVPEPAALRGGDDPTRRLRDALADLSRRLPAHARIGDLAITTQGLPRTQIGKLRRHELPPLFAEAKSGARRPKPDQALSKEDRALLATPPVDRIWPWLEARFEDKAPTLDASPQLDLGMDSFDWMSLTMELEERFGVRLDEEALARVGSLRDLLEEALAAAKAGPAEPEARTLTPEQARWLNPQGPVLARVARLAFALNHALMRLCYRVRVEGIEGLPRNGAVLLAPNHTSYLDPFALAAVLPYERLRGTYWAGWTGLLFRGPLTRAFSRIAQVLPVDPERGLTSTLAVGRAALEHGFALVWFPEGARSADGHLQPFLPGVGWLLEKSGVPVVPIHIAGSFEAWPPDRRLPRPGRIVIRVGEPVEAGALAPDDGENERHDRIAGALRERVAALGDG